MATQQDFQAELQIIREAANVAWETSEKEFLNLQVQFQWDLIDGPVNGQKRVGQQAWTVAVDEARQLKIARMENPKFPESISHEVSNSRYQFEIDAAKKNERGILSELQIASPGNAGPAPANWIHQISVLKCRFQFGTIPLKLIFDSPEFVCTEVNGASAPNALVQLKFLYSGSKGMWRIPGATYDIWLNPSHNYRMEKWKFGFPNTERVETYDITYHEIDDVPTPRTVTYRADTSEFTNLQTWTIERPTSLQLDEAEFYLAHYGFSESVLETLRPNPWPRWLIVILGVLLLGIGLRFIRKKS